MVSKIHRFYVRWFFFMALYQTSYFCTAIAHETTHFFLIHQCFFKNRWLCKTAKRNEVGYTLWFSCYERFTHWTFASKMKSCNCFLLYFIYHLYVVDLKNAFLKPIHLCHSVFNVIWMSWPFSINSIFCIQCH